MFYPLPAGQVPKFPGRPVPGMAIFTLKITWLNFSYGVPAAGEPPPRPARPPPTAGPGQYGRPWKLSFIIPIHPAPGSHGLRLGLALRVKATTCKPYRKHAYDMCSRRRTARRIEKGALSERGALFRAQALRSCARVSGHAVLDFRHAPLSGNRPGVPHRACLDGHHPDLVDCPGQSPAPSSG